MFSWKIIFGLIIGLSNSSFVVASNNDLIDVGRFNFTSGQKQVEIPFYTFNNQVILAITVNDRVPLNFILDSGTAQAVFFDRKLAQELRIGFGRKIQFSGIGRNNPVTAFRGRGVKLGLPGVEGQMMGMAILNVDYMDMRRFDIHGVIGYQLFSRFAVKIDFQNRVLTLMEPDHYNSNGFHSLEMNIENSKPYINSELGLDDDRKIPLKLMIDTGAAYGLTLIAGAHPAIKIPKKSKRMRLGSGLGGDISGFKGTTTIKLHAALSSRIETFYVNPGEFSRKGNYVGRMGSIGADLLNEYTVIIDYVNSRMHLRLPEKPLYLTENNKT